MHPRTLSMAALLAGLAVVMGAFGAHALRPVLSEPMRAVWETAVRYQMWHALGLGLIACIQDDAPLPVWSGRLMAAGTVLFSGSLYLLALTGIGAWGLITPFGGLTLVTAWGLLAFHFGRKQHA